MIEFREFDESWKSRTRFEMTPMIDMIFLLLIFFLLTSTLTNPVITVELPESEIVDTRIEQDIVITVDSKGRLFLDEQEYSKEALAAEISSIYLDRDSSDIFIQADENVDFGIIVDVMDICRKNGAFDLAFIVEGKVSP